jgi:hypothetical protein
MYIIYRTVNIDVHLMFSFILEDYVLVFTVKYDWATYLKWLLKVDLDKVSEVSFLLTFYEKKLFSYL